MRCKCRQILLSSFLALVHWPAALSAEAPEYVLDPATGEIGGQKALVIYPGIFDQGKVVELLDPDGFVAHLTDAEDPDVDLVYDCGKWFVPPPGFYRVWAEGDWLISPYTRGLAYAGKPFEGRGMSTAAAVVEAGRVALPPDIQTTGPKLSLRLLRATDHTIGHIVLGELTRRRRIDRVGDGLLMPAGPVIAALWDDGAQRYAAISRPFDVRHRETVAAPLERPEETAHLVAQIVRASPAGTVAELGMLPVLHRGDRELSPDLKVETVVRVYAVWFDLEPGPAELRAASDRHWLPPTALELRPGTIESFVGELEKKPNGLFRSPLERSSSAEN